MPKGIRNDGTKLGIVKGSKKINGRFYSPEQLAEFAAQAQLACDASDAAATNAKPKRTPAQMEALNRGRAIRHAQMRQKSAAVNTAAQTLIFLDKAAKAKPGKRQWNRIVPNIVLSASGIDFAAMTFGQRIVWLRQALLMSQAELAERAGLSVAGFQTIVRRESVAKVRGTSVQHIAAALGCDALWLAYGVGDMGLTKRNAIAAVEQAQRNIVAQLRASGE